MKKDKPRIVIVNGWHDDNKGDSAIVEATLNLLRQRWPEARLGLVSMFPASHPAFKTAHRHLLRHFPDLEVVPSPAPVHDPSRLGGRFGGTTVWLGQMPLALLRLLPVFPKGQPGLRLISEADLILANGGHYLYNHKYHLRSWGRLFQLLYPLLAARSYKVPYVLFGQSLGPFEDWFGANMAKFVLSKAQAVWVREELSRQVALRIGVPASKLAVIPDAAFALRPFVSERVKNVLSRHGLKPGSFWVVTVRQWPHGPRRERQARTELFLDEMAALVREALRAGLKVVLVAHTQGPTEIEDDRIPTRSLAQRLGGKAITVIEEDFSPSELVALYGSALLVVGTRFHSVILAMAGGTPAYAVSYFGPKAWGIMEMLGMKELCSDMEKFSAKEAFARIEALDLLAMATEIRKRVRAFRKQLEDAIDRLDEMI